MQWTTTTPTVPGWYWFRRPGSRAQCVEVVSFEYPLGDDLRAQVVGREDWFGVREPHFAGGQWAGPVPLPEVGSPPPPRLGGGEPPAMRT